MRRGHVKATQYLLDKEIIACKNVKLIYSDSAHLPADFFKALLMPNVIVHIETVHKFYKFIQIQLKGLPCRFMSK